MTTTPASASTAGSRFLVRADALRILLSAASVAADSGRAGVPVLASVHLRWDTDALTTTSTDRYRLAEASVPVQSGASREGLVARVTEPGEAIVPLADVSTLVKLIGRDTTSVLTVELRDGDPLGQRLVTSIGDVAWSALLVPGDYPRVAPVWEETSRPPVAVESISFNPAFLADVAKMTTSKPGKGVTYTFYGRHKPALATGRTVLPRVSFDVAWRYLLMPVPGAPAP